MELSTLIHSMHSAVTGHGPTVTCYHSAVTGHCRSVTGYHSAVTGYDPPVTGYHSAVNGYGPALTGYHSAVTGYGPALTGYQSAVIGYSPPVTTPCSQCFSVPSVTLLPVFLCTLSLVSALDCALAGISVHSLSSQFYGLLVHSLAHSLERGCTIEGQSALRSLLVH